MSEINIPTEVLHKILNLGGMQKSLYCKRCKEFTEQVSISYGEGSAHPSNWTRVIGRLMDFAPMLPLVTGNNFACTKCGRIRAEGGLGSDVIGGLGELDVKNK